MSNEPTTPDEAPESKGSGMKKLVIAFTAILIIAVGVRVFLIYRANQEAAKPAVAAAEPSYTDDQMVLPRHLHQMDMKDARELNGKRIWVFAAGQLNAYPATPTHMDYMHPGPLLLGAQPLDVVNFIEGKKPDAPYSRIPAGDAQVFMLFHRADDPTKLWGTPVGYREGKVYTFSLDEAFFYDDPHVLYKHWPAETWKAIDEHKVIKGMSEMQTNLALGQVSKPGPGSVGNRTIVYDNDGHPITVTFVKDKAAEIS
jgi:hypothetical protein